MALFSTLNNKLELVEDIHFCHIVYMCILGHSTLIRGPLGEFVLFIADAGKTYDDILN